MRELLLMGQARLGLAWELASVQMALLANCHRDSKKRSQPFTSTDFNPIKQSQTKTRRTVGGLEKLLTGGDKSRIVTVYPRSKPKGK